MVKHHVMVCYVISIIYWTEGYEVKGYKYNSDCLSPTASTRHSTPFGKGAMQVHDRPLFITVFVFVCSNDVPFGPTNIQQTSDTMSEFGKIVYQTFSS